MIDNDTLLAYALNGLEADETSRLREALRDDTAAQARLDRIQSLLRPLEADRETPLPPTGLADGTLKALDRMLARPRPVAPPIRRWVELAVAASIGLVGFGVIVSGVNLVQNDHRIRTCADNLRMISSGLHTYADTHQNRFPQVPEARAAACFQEELAGSGHWPTQARSACDQSITTPVGYTYTLGYRAADGSLVGPTREAGRCGSMPLAADFPAGNVHKQGPVSPHRGGHNVLFADGHVLFLKTALLEHDHIFLNDAGLPRAGLHPNDAVLGHPFDMP